MCGPAAVWTSACHVVTHAAVPGHGYSYSPIGIGRRCPADTGCTMGLRFQRSMKLLPGVRLNFSKSGIGMSLGVPGARISFSPRGRVTQRVGIPGTGISWVSSRSTKRRASNARPSASATASAAAPLPPAPPTPGLFSNADERDVFRAFKAKDVATLNALAAAGDKAAVLAGFYAALVLSDQGDAAAALKSLDASWHRTSDIDSDPLFAKYAHAMTVTVDICPNAKVSAPGSRDTAGLLYAELLQKAGRASEALAVVKQLTWGPAAAISAADLMLAMGDFDGVLTVTNNIDIVDDGTALIAVYRATAFRRTGLLDAALDCLRPATSSRVKDVGVKHEALLERARVRLVQGDMAAARRDVESVLAADSSDPVAQALLTDIARATPNADSASTTAP